MPHIHLPRPWDLPEHALTDEDAWLSRRALVKALGLGSIGAAAGLVPGRARAGTAGPVPETFAYDLPSVERNPAYPLDRPLTDEAVAASYNNFYEFTTAKDQVWRLAKDFEVEPWTLTVGGLVHEEQTFDIDALLKAMPLEERTYRFRCVEAWSMAVPWIGFPLKALLDRVEPLGKAKYVRLVTLDDPKRFPGVRSQGWYPWPYHEGLSMAEARNELTLLAVGIYGHALPNQHGAPIRLVTPWKYGFKNIKSIARIELVEEQPPTFWNTIAAKEYDFLGNVRPDIPHPRWSQASERVIPTGERVPTLMYNGYAELVAHLYKKSAGAPG